MKVVRNTLMEEIVTSPRYKREPLHSLAIVENFSRFHQQDEHNASFYSIKSRHLSGRTCRRVGGAKIQKFLSPKHAKNRKIDAEKHPKTSNSSLFRKEQML